MFKYLIILPCLLLVFQPLNAKVDPPNYDFSIETLLEFMPGKFKNELETKFGKGEVIDDWGSRETMKFSVAHLRYKFPVVVQVKDGRVTDFFAKLPSYFLHDVFHQSLINKLGKQDSYKKVGEEAVYLWNKGPVKYVYSAGCTITCFPIFFTVYSTDATALKPLIETLKEGVKKK